MCIRDRYYIITNSLSHFTIFHPFTNGLSTALSTVLSQDQPPDPLYHLPSHCQWAVWFPIYDFFTNSMAHSPILHLPSDSHLPTCTNLAFCKLQGWFPIYHSSTNQVCHTVHYAITITLPSTIVAGPQLVSRICMLLVFIHVVAGTDQETYCMLLSCLKDISLSPIFTLFPKGYTSINAVYIEASLRPALNCHTVALKNIRKIKYG